MLRYNTLLETQHQHQEQSTEAEQAATELVLRNSRLRSLTLSLFLCTSLLHSLLMLNSSKI